MTRALRPPQDTRVTDRDRGWWITAARTNHASAFADLRALDVETRDEAFHAALEVDAVDVVDALLAGRVTGASLRLAARHGATRSMARLLDRGAPADERDEWGRHALALAIAERHDAVIEVFLDRRLALDGSSLAAAILRGDEALVLRLVEAGAPLTEHARRFALDRAMTKVAALEASTAPRPRARQLSELPSRERLRVLALLAHLAWVDDELDEREAALVRELASKAALLPDERVRVEGWLEAPPSDELLGSARALAPESRALFCDLAHRLVDADGRRTDDEAQTLVLLGLLLRA